MVFLNSNYESFLLAERNSDLVVVYKYIQLEGLAFIEECASLFRPENNQEHQYYLLREQFNHCKNIRRRAQLFIYLNRHGYNGLCRYNKSGAYNVPFGRYIKPYFPLAEMVHFYHKSSGATFVESDFRATFALSQPGDVIYCDPPYVGLSKSANFSAYTAGGFGEKEQVDLAQLAIACAEKNCSVIISNHDTPLTREYYKTAKLVSFPVMRNISCNPKKRVAVQELLAIFN